MTGTTEDKKVALDYLQSAIDRQKVCKCGAPLRLIEAVLLELQNEERVFCRRCWAVKKNPCGLTMEQITQRAQAECRAQRIQLLEVYDGQRLSAVP